MTFAEACGHMTNFTSGHETRSRTYGDERFAFRDQHIEVDNRLSWFLGGLHERFPDARYVHLIRDPEAVAASYLARWNRHPPPRVKNPARPLGALRRRLHSKHPGPGIMHTFAHSIVGLNRPWPEEERADVARFLVATVTSNVDHFLRDKPSMTVMLGPDVKTEFTAFWRWIDARGDLDGALAEWDVRHNAG
jgi:hypothetical protein